MKGYVQDSIDLVAWECGPEVRIGDALLYVDEGKVTIDCSYPLLQVTMDFTDEAMECELPGQMLCCDPSMTLMAVIFTHDNPNEDQFSADGMSLVAYREENGCLTCGLFVSFRTECSLVVWPSRRSSGVTFSFSDGELEYLTHSQCNIVCTPQLFDPVSHEVLDACLGVIEGDWFLSICDKLLWLTPEVSEEDLEQQVDSGVVVRALFFGNYSISVESYSSDRPHRILASTSDCHVMVVAVADSSSDVYFDLEGWFYEITLGNGVNKVRQDTFLAAGF